MINTKKIYESVINKTEVEEAFTDRFMSMNFPIKLTRYFMSTISSCKHKII